MKVTFAVKRCCKVRLMDYVAKYVITDRVLDLDYSREIFEERAYSNYHIYRYKFFNI